MYAHTEILTDGQPEIVMPHTPIGGWRHKDMFTVLNFTAWLVKE